MDVFVGFTCFPLCECVACPSLPAPSSSKSLDEGRRSQCKAARKFANKARHFELGSNRRYFSFSSICEQRCFRASSESSEIMSAILATVEGLWDFAGADDEDLPFQAGDILHVLDQSDADWWQVSC